MKWIFIVFYIALAMQGSGLEFCDLTASVQNATAGIVELNTDVRSICDCMVDDEILDGMFVTGEYYHMKSFGFIKGNHTVIVVCHNIDDFHDYNATKIDINAV